METQKVGKIVRDGLLAGVKTGIKNHETVFVLNYSAVSSAQMDGLRKDLSRIGAKVHIPKNRIAKLAFKELQNEKLAEVIKGQTAIIWTNADAVAVSKALVKFSEKFESVKIGGGLVDGAVLERADVKRLSDLPAKEVLQAKLLGLLNAPVSRLLGAMNAKSRELLSILKQYSEQKGGN